MGRIFSIPISGLSIPGHGSPLSPTLEGPKLDPATIDLYDRTVDLVKERKTRNLLTELKNDEARNMIEFLHKVGTFPPAVIPMLHRHYRY